MLLSRSSQESNPKTDAAKKMALSSSMFPAAPRRKQKYTTILQRVMDDAIINVPFTVEPEATPKKKAVE